MENEKILNVWGTTSTKVDYFYYLGSPIYANGDYRIFRQFSNSYLYTYKNIAITQLAGLNKPLLDSIAKRERPSTKDCFLYDRALETLERGLKIVTNQFSLS